ncbi:MAG: hypothetical protein ACI9WL_000096 [Rubritalea sp.]|jgi:hypothetical protein
MKLLLFCILSLFFLNKDPVERFTYQERSQLSWKDFKGVPPKNIKNFASVNSGIGYTFSSKTINSKVVLNIQVESYFYPQLSWKKNINENNRNLLLHEQLHWDISELYARKLRAAYKRYVPQKNPEKEIDFIFKKFEKERQKTQKIYDLETKHGLIRTLQIRWNDKIKEELFKTSQFANNL